MDRQTIEALVLEAETSWQQLFHIDNRRGAYFLSFNATFCFLAAGAVALIAFTPKVSPLLALAATVVLGSHIAFGHYLIGAYESERAANVRYRQKINLIREILLSKAPEPEIQDYLKRKEIGIKTFTGAGNEIDRLGGTLKQMYMLIRVQQVASSVLAAIVWASALASAGA